MFKIFVQLQYELNVSWNCSSFVTVQTASSPVFSNSSAEVLQVLQVSQTPAGLGYWDLDVNHSLSIFVIYYYFLFPLSKNGILQLF